MFIIVLGQHVSIPVGSSSGPSKKTDPYLAMFKNALWDPKSVWDPTYLLTYSMVQSPS